MLILTSIPSAIEKVLPALLLQVKRGRKIERGENLMSEKSDRDKIEEEEQKD